MSKPDYDTTLARIAGNIAAGLVSKYTVGELDYNHPHDWVALRSVSLARAIVAEVKRTAPAVDQDRKPTP